MKNIKKENPGYFLHAMSLYMHDEWQYSSVWSKCR